MTETMTSNLYDKKYSKSFRQGLPYSLTKWLKGCIGSLSLAFFPLLWKNHHHRGLIQISIYMGLAKWKWGIIANEHGSPCTQSKCRSLRMSILFWLFLGIIEFVCILFWLLLGKMDHNVYSVWILQCHLKFATSWW